MNSHIASELAVERTKERRSARVLAVFSLGPVTVLAGLGWAILQPYRVTLLHPHGEGFWWLFVEPPLLVMLVGAVFHLLVAPAVVEDLEAADSPHVPGASLAKEPSGRRAGQHNRYGPAQPASAQTRARSAAIGGVRLGAAERRPAEPSRPGA